MSIEIVMLDQQINVTVDEAWNLISVHCALFLHHPPPGFLRTEDLQKADVRNSISMDLTYCGLHMKIITHKDANRVIWLGVTGGDRPLGHYEHIFGYFDVSPVYLSKDAPVHVRIVCSYEPLYYFFQMMAENLRLGFIEYPSRNQHYKTLVELLAFKALVERQLYTDFFHEGRPYEYIGRGLLQAFVQNRSYREVPTRGGRSDLLVFSQEGQDIYETKLWRGPKYFEAGLQEIAEYINGEHDDGQLRGAFYVIYDPTQSYNSRKYLGDEKVVMTVAGRDLYVVTIWISPPTPSTIGSLLGTGAAWNDVE